MPFLHGSTFFSTYYFKVDIGFLVYRQRLLEGESDSEEDEDDGCESSSVSEEEDNEESKTHFMGFCKAYFHQNQEVLLLSK